MPATEAIRIEYEQQPGDLAEVRTALIVPGATPPSAKPSPSRSALGWLLFISLAVLLFFLLRSQQDREPRFHAPDPIVASVPYLRIGLPMVVIGFAILWGGLRFARRLARPLRVKSIYTLTAAGIITERTGIRAERDWSVFHSFVETPRFFVLRQSLDRALIWFPRNACGDAWQQEIVRAIITDGVERSKERT